MNVLSTPKGEQPPLLHRPIGVSDYPALFKLDRRVYPTDSPVTAEVVDGWYKWNREFGIVFPGEEPGSIAGLFAVIPLSQAGWENLTSGTLTEAQMKDDMIFDPKTDTELGLHNYHIESLTREKGFYTKALNALGSVVGNLGPQVKLLGFSAYAVTDAGVGLHKNKLNMRERDFISTEYVINEDKKLRVSNLNPGEVERLKKEEVGLRRCEMLITTPDEKSEVWEFLKRKD